MTLPPINPQAFGQKAALSKPLLSTAAVARWLGVATRTICLWAECSEIPAIKVGRQWRFREDELREWLRGPQAAKVTNVTKPRTGAAAV